MEIDDRIKIIDGVLKKIARSQSTEARTDGNSEKHLEYDLLKESNELSTSINEDVASLHRTIRDRYSTRFPELETLVTTPINYAKTVAILKNGPLEDIKSIASSTDNIVGQSLNQILDGPSLMVVAVEASSTKGRAMTDSELHTVLKACETALLLDRAKITFTNYIQSRMNTFAPNMTAVVGSLTAAQFLVRAGSINKMAEANDRDILAWGSTMQPGLDAATRVSFLNRGSLFHSSIIQAVPDEYRMQAMRTVAGKFVLAARLDQHHQFPDGSQGVAWRSHCEDKIEKLQKSSKNQGTPALPVPDDKPARKRGGWAARKAKEAVAMTEMQKLRNRVAFGEEEKEVGYGTGEGTKGLGMLGQAANGGKIRSTQIDQKTRAKLSKKNPGWGGAATSMDDGIASSLRGMGSGPSGSATTLRAQGLRTSGVGSEAGTASSITFNPKQGLELVDPKIQAGLSQKRKAEENRWFATGTFTQVGSGGSASDGGFKIPAPPQKKMNTGAS
ncbi:MAG: hypothetical protein Q9160_000882 [Pyrenula sp. 1 TL-2023]